MGTLVSVQVSVCALVKQQLSKVQFSGSPNGVVTDFLMEKGELTKGTLQSNGSAGLGKYMRAGPTWL